MILIRFIILLQSLKFLNSDLLTIKTCLQEFEDLTCNHQRIPTMDVSSLQMYCYDVKNSYSALFCNLSTAACQLKDDRILVKNSNFHFFVPGFGESESSLTGLAIRKSYMDIKNVTLCILNHIKYTYIDLSDRENGCGRRRASQYAYFIGDRFADFLNNFFKVTGTSKDRVLLYGHSLGAQICGYTAKAFKYAAGFMLGRVAGLDPSRKCFDKTPSTEQLHKGDADFVDIIHCNSGDFGTSNDLGDAIFFPNGGEQQPGCQNKSLCSHLRCVTLWAASLTRPSDFLAVECNSYNDFVRGECNYDNVVEAGFGCPPSARRLYFYNTTSTYPYGDGIMGITNLNV